MEAKCHTSLFTRITKGTSRLAGRPASFADVPALPT